MVPLQQPITDDGTALQDILEDTQTPQPEALVAEEQVRRGVEACLSHLTKKRREASAFMPGMDRRWARRAQCPRAQQYPRSARALNGRGHCIGGSPGIHAGEDVHTKKEYARGDGHEHRAEGLFS